jgi:hypothetical protein
LVEVNKFDNLIADILKGELDARFWKKTRWSKKTFRKIK